ncbi:hypothetical protein GCM10025760_34360 [Microbacterium yannicii]|uniref:Helix-turn-helix domain-containing protein n=1 Tax=Microbacterium yannicii TaxID=671622 RepID=A0ABP9MQC0_9MICO|nr:hypothetical protein [Microbacterium yannicii]MCO5951900.1 hypothetical protein [Microbacterium yannicii]
MGHPAGHLEARKLRAEGHSLRSIAGQLGVGRSTVMRWCEGVDPGPLRALDRGAAERARQDYEAEADTIAADVLDRAPWLAAAPEHVTRYARAVARERIAERLFTRRAPDLDSLADLEAAAAVVDTAAKHAEARGRALGLDPLTASKMTRARVVVTLAEVLASQPPTRAEIEA